MGVRGAASAAAKRSGKRAEDRAAMVPAASKATVESFDEPMRSLHFVTNTTLSNELVELVEHRIPSTMPTTT